MKKMTLTFVFALIISVLTVTGAMAKYPTKAINIICPFGPGGTGDLVARVLANAVKDDFEKPVVVVNRPGAGSIVGTTMATQSKPDGYTLLAGRIASNGIIPALNKTISYKWDDFVFLGLLDLNPLVFVVHKDSPYQTMADLAKAIKESNGEMSFCNAGALNVQELAAYAFLQSIDLDKSGAVSVPFQSDGAGKNAILGKHVDFGALTFGATYDQLGEGGNLRALAVTTAERLPKYPNIPTVREAGYPELENILGWDALFGIKGMPQEAIDSWVTALSNLEGNEKWDEPIANMSSISNVLSPAETKEFVENQVKMFEELGNNLDLIVR